MWKIEPAVTELRKARGWSEFHRECGRAQLYFDHITRSGRKYTATAFTVRKVDDIYLSTRLSEETGATPLAALEAAYRASGRTVAAAEPWLAAMQGTDLDLDDLLGGDAITIEDLLG